MEEEDDLEHRQDDRNGGSGGALAGRRLRTGEGKRPTWGVVVFHPQLRSTYVLAGPLRWVEPDGRRAVLRVDAAGGRARRFCGRSVTLALDRCPHVRAMDPDRDDGLGLRPGQVVTVKARLPRRLKDLPDVVCPRSVLSLGPVP